MLILTTIHPCIILIHFLLSFACIRARESDEEISIKSAKIPDAGRRHCTIHRAWSMEVGRGRKEGKRKHRRNMKRENCIFERRVHERYVERSRSKCRVLYFALRTRGKIENGDRLFQPVWKFQKFYADRDIYLPEFRMWRFVDGSCRISYGNTLWRIKEKIFHLTCIRVQRTIYTVYVYSSVNNMQVNNTPWKCAIHTNHFNKFSLFSREKLHELSWKVILMLAEEEKEEEWNSCNLISLLIHAVVLFPRDDKEHDVWYTCFRILSFHSYSPIIFTIVEIL